MAVHLGVRSGLGGHFVFDFQLTCQTITSIRPYLYVCHSIRLSFDELIDSGAFNDILKNDFRLG